MKKNNGKERMLGTSLKWSTYSISTYFSWAVLGYVVYFSTDTLGLDSGIIGAIILVSKILDAITNFLAATLVDNCHFKKGKGRPWNIFVIPMWISIILMFSIPAEWGDTAKYIMIFLMYTLVNAVFATIVGCVENIYLKHAFLEEKQRVTISTVSNGLGTVSMTVGSIIMPLLVSRFETMEHGWTILTAAVGIPMALIGSIRYFTIPERDVRLADDDVKPVTLGDTLKAFFSNKYTIILMFMLMCVQIVNTFGTGTPLTYYFKYIVGDIDQASAAGAMAIPALLILIVLPRLAEKFGRVQVLKVSFIVAALAFALRFFAEGNMVVICVLTFISTAALMPFSVFNSLMLIDSMDYDRWKNERDLEGAVFAGSSLGTTIGNGLGSALAGGVLSVFGYNGLSEVQSDSALFGMKACIGIVPALFMVIIFVLLLLYDLEDRLPQIKKELQEREQSRSGR